MLKKREIIFKKDENSKLNEKNGSLLHGFLMENMSEEAAAILHKDSLRPYSQYMYFSKEFNRWVWTINTLNKWVNSAVEDAISNLNKVELKHKNSVFEIDHTRIHPGKSYKELTTESYSREGYRNIIVTFQTPCSFKVSGNNVIYPEIKFIYNNILNRWNSFSDLVSINDKEAIEHIIEHTYVHDFSIKGSRYSLKSANIRGFVGRIHFKVKGPDSLVALSNVMFKFAEYSGLGSRTALGMGGIKVELK